MGEGPEHVCKDLCESDDEKAKEIKQNAMTRKRQKGSKRRDHFHSLALCNESLEV